METDDERQLVTQDTVTQWMYEERVAPKKLADEKKFIKISDLALKFKEHTYTRSDNTQISFLIYLLKYVSAYPSNKPILQRRPIYNTWQELQKNNGLVPLHPIINKIKKLENRNRNLKKINSLESFSCKEANYYIKGQFFNNLQSTIIFCTFMFCITILLSKMLLQINN